MAAVYALVTFVAAAITAALLWPLMGLAALLVAPFGASLSVVAAALGIARFAPRDRSLDEDLTDGMVSDLRGVGDAARRPASDALPPERSRTVA